MDSFAVEELEQNRQPQFGLTLMAGRKGLKRKISHTQVQKMGLALTGFVEFVNRERLQVLGKTEMVYLGTLAPDVQREVIQRICGLEIACIVVTRGLEIPRVFLDEADRKGIPLFRTDLLTTEFIDRVAKFLEWKLAPTTSIHGVMMDVFGVGVLILGKSGIGKSECALDLILRGHRLVADDMVFIQRRGPLALLGSGFEVIQHHMEIRGLGIINIKEIFGPRSVASGAKIDLIVKLKKWRQGFEVDRLGLKVAEDESILGIRVPQVAIPVAPGRNIASLIEVACKVHLLRKRGYHAPAEIVKRLDKALS
jgi:HPr kinase/phosphorylase